MGSMDEATRARLLAEFTACLDDMDRDMPEDDPRAVDLYSLLSEMAALKNEIRIESRQFKGALDDFRTFAETLNGHTRRLERDLDRAREEASGNERRIERNFLLGLLTLRDSLQAGVNAAGNPPRSFWDRLIPGPQRFANSLAEGQRLTLRRLDDTLESYGVRPMPVLGAPLDPNSMRVVGVEANDTVANGTVLREARSGFFYHADVLRIAEVIVSKKDHPT